MSESGNPLQWLKRTVVEIIGRDRANRITAPYYDWRAQRRSSDYTAKLPATGLLLNLGCGYKPLPGWVNVDGARGSQVDVVWDLRNPLPFPSNSCASVFCEHVIEHLSRAAAESFLRECLRVLEPGGVARFSTPDAELYLRSYVTDRKFLYHPNFPEKIETPLDRINSVMRESGQHLWLYDGETLELLLRRVGFSSVVRQGFHESLQSQMANVDSEERAFESLYLEAVK